MAALAGWPQHCTGGRPCNHPTAADNNQESDHLWHDTHSAVQCSSTLPDITKILEPWWKLPPLGDDILIYSTHLHSNRLFKSTSTLKYELSILFLFIMLRELPTQLIDLLTIDDCHYLSYAETPVEGSALILLLLMLCWKSENPCTYVASSLPSAPVSGAGIVFTGPRFSACLKLAAKCWNFPPNVSLCGAYRVIILMARSGVTLLLLIRLSLFSTVCI